MWTKFEDRHKCTKDWEVLIFIKVAGKHILKMTKTENKMGDFSILFCITFSHPLSGLPNEVVLTATAANRIQKYHPFICILLNACLFTQLQWPTSAASQPCKWSNETIPQINSWREDLKYYRGLNAVIWNNTYLWKSVILPTYKPG